MRVSMHTGYQPAAGRRQVCGRTRGATPRGTALLCTLAAVLSGCAAGPTCAPPSRSGAGIEAPELAQQVEIRRTTYGVPQILAENLRAAAFALAYVQAEDYGDGVIRAIVAARGEQALIEGYAHVEDDFRSRQLHARAIETFHLLRQDSRDVYEGFAAGLNHFIRTNRDELPAWTRPDFTAYDVLARDIGWPYRGAIDRFRERILEDSEDPPVLAARGALGPAGEAPDGPGRRMDVDGEDQNVGSNAWALGPSRTTSGNAILLRNPHLSWTAGYHEAHIRVPGKLDFYGDFRIGGPFTVIGGFNPHLGFASTDNTTRTREFYAFHADPAQADHILLDGGSVPLRRELITVGFREGSGFGCETREFWTSPLGPVVHRGDDVVYIHRSPTDGEFRAGEQWLAMMKARTIDEWKDAMRIRALAHSNFIYADRDGNTFYVWLSAPPALPHPSGGDSLAILATRTDDVWTRLVPFDSLPQLLNPPGGYMHNENDSPHFTNLNRIVDHESFSFWVQEPRLRLRSQHAISLLHNDRLFSLEDVVDAKHSMRMLLADRVKDDLVAAVRQSDPETDVARAIALIDEWDNTAAAESRGAVLFQTWWEQYESLLEGREPHAVPWSSDDPAATPRGLAEPGRAVEAFERAVYDTERRFGGWDVAWGEVHRVRRGEVDVPVGGCGAALGCFRVLGFETADDGKRVVTGGDGWVLAVEFGDPPRAYSILAYGQSPDPSSPFHANQAEMFAANRMKAVKWTEADIERALVLRYRPGEKPSTRVVSK